MTRLRAPEGTNSAAVENTQYEVDEHGHIEVENGEHVAQLAAHGFTYADDPELTHSEHVDEVGECPDFSKFANRQTLVEWLAAHGNDEHTGDETRQSLEAACVEHHARVAAGEAQRLEPETVEQPEGEGEGDEDPDATEGEDPDATEGEGEGDKDPDATEGDKDPDATEGDKDPDATEGE